VSLVYQRVSRLFGVLAADLFAPVWFGLRLGNRREDAPD
jgi:hypothetical protein